jgi:hypothetical protein
VYGLHAVRYICGWPGLGSWSPCVECTASSICPASRMFANTVCTVLYLDKLNTFLQTVERTFH